MTQRVTTIETTLFAHDGRGPSLIHWLHDRDLAFPDSNVGYAPWKGDIVGAQYTLPLRSETAPESLAWIIFYGLQVIQIVPEEVHRAWHHNSNPAREPITGIWRVHESAWLASFQQRYLSAHDHYVVEFYDEVVEVVCRELILGVGQFAIAAVLPTDHRFAYAYLRYAESQERQGNIDGAIEYLQHYIQTTRDEQTRAYAQRKHDHLQGNQQHPNP